MATRTIFFTISTRAQVLFYLLALASLGICFYGVYRRVLLARQGRPIAPIHDWPARLKELWQQGVQQRRVRRRRYAGKMHLLIFFGLFALFVGTTIVAIEHYGALVFGPHWFYRGWFYLATKLTLDLFGMGLIIGTVMALARRHGFKPRSLGHEPRDDAFLVLLLVANLTGFLLEGAGIAADPARAPYAGFSPIGGLIAHSLHGIHPTTYALIWWIHIPLVLGVIAALPYGRWLHIFIIPITILIKPDRPMGALEPESMERVEETGRVGLGTLSDLDFGQLLSLDGCMGCGRCTDACPANAVGKPLNPKQIVLDLRSLLVGSKPDEQGQSAASTDIISDDALWACTNCHACVRECPALIRHVDIIDGIRRFRVAEGRLSGSAATMLRQLGSRENPWGLPASQRIGWADGLNVNLLKAGEQVETLLWVGCAGAFDPRGQKTVRALAQLLQQAGESFAILGPRERCTGDPARRTGDEFLFQQLAAANIETLAAVKPKRIVANCPHCLNTLRNEYPQFGGNYNAVHHTEYLQELVASGRLKPTAAATGSVTYHDPCFLARVNGITEPPRQLLRASNTEPIQETERRESRTFCCGAGGGRMWMEEDPGKRPGVERARELLATGAGTIAVGCPFCKVMVSDSVAQVGGESLPRVVDIAELMLAATADAAAAQPESAAEPPR